MAKDKLVKVERKEISDYPFKSMILRLDSVTQQWDLFVEIGANSLKDILDIVAHGFNLDIDQVIELAATHKLETDFYTFRLIIREKGTK